MRFQINSYFYVFCLVLLGFIFVPNIESANAQDWCCNNDSAMGGPPGQCTSAPMGAGSCNGAALSFFETPFVVPLPNGPSGPGDLCPPPGPNRGACQCIDQNGDTVDCTDLLVDGCCVVDPSIPECIENNYIECSELGGTFQGNGTTCDQVDVCNPVDPTGCCQIGDECTASTTATQCAIDGGTFGGEGVACGDGACVAPMGCCQVGDMCSDTTETECTEGQGIFGGVGVQCGTDPCVDPTGCCVIDNECTEPVTQDECDGGTFQIDGICGRGECMTEPEGCCVEGNECNNSVLESDCDGNFELDGTCGVECVVTPIGTGCCVEDNQCTNDVDPNNCSGTFDLGQFCGQGLCVVEPEGCCVCGDSECSITTESECSDMGCTYQGDDTVCDGIDECSDVPGCCFLDVNGGDATLANRQIDPNKCIETTATICNLDGGDFQGVGTSCLNDFPQECSFPTRDIPTLSQWGLIAMAGLLGIFSLMIIMRRQKYNLS